MRPPRGQGAHEDPRRVDGIEADAVCEQRAAGTPPRGVHQHEPQAQVRVLQAEAAHELVRHAGLARATGSGEADHRRRAPGAALGELLAQPLERGDLAPAVVLEPGDESGHRHRIRRCETRHLVRDALDGAPAALVENDADHALQTEAAAVLGAEDARHAAGVELGDLLEPDRAAAAAVDAHLRRAALAQALHQVAVELQVTALVGRHRHGVRVLLDRGGDDLLHRAIVAQVDHLGALGLEQAAHDVDGRVVAVEERGGGDHPHAVRRAMQRRDLGGRRAHARLSARAFRALAGRRPMRAATESR